MARTRTRSIRCPGLGVALAALLALVAGACSDPQVEEFTGAPGVSPAETDLEPGADPALGVERFLAQLEERTGYRQRGHVEAVDGVTTLWVHVDPEHEAWVTDAVGRAELEGLAIVAAQPVGGHGDLAADARRYSTAEIAGYRDVVVEVASRLGVELAEGRAEDPEAHPTSADIEVVYGRSGDRLTVLLVARFDRLPPGSTAELRALVPPDLLDLQLDAEQ